MKKVNLKRGFKSWSEKQAVYYRSLLNLKPFDNLLATKLSEILNVSILTPGRIENLDTNIQAILSTNRTKWSALTFECNNSFYIILNDSHSLERQKSNVLHELAHIICKHQMQGFKNIGQFSFRIYDHTQEAEAEWLGGCLHIPRAGLEWALRKKLSRDKLCKHFCASNAMVQFRINVTGVDYQYKINRKI